MRVLVACEFSGVVRDAFIRKGHDAVSCDLVDAWSYGPHYKGDVRDILDDGWDMMIAFPPCTYLTKAHSYKNGTEKQRYDAVKFWLSLYSAEIPRIAIENPPGWINSHIIKPTQNVQPWYFGHPFTKQTSLWLLNLPKLIPTKLNYFPMSYTDLVRDPMERSKTFPGIARAMASQWGVL